MLTIDEDFELRIPIQMQEDLKELFNSSDVYSQLPRNGGSTAVNDISADYEQFLADVWVGIVLTLMVLSCVCFMCSCLIYHKFQQWKSRVMEARSAANVESAIVETDLPSYTIASGLPSYEEALEQLKKVKDPDYAHKSCEISDWTPRTPPTPTATPLSVVNLFTVLENKQFNVVKI